MSLSIDELRTLAKQAVRDGKVKDFQEIFESATERDSPYKTELIDLSTAYSIYKPYRILTPFRAFWVLDASDSTATAQISFNSRESQNVEDGIPIRKNFLMSEMPLVQEAWITASAQAGKWLKIVFLKSGKIDPGLVISQNAGGVAINEGAAITTRTNVGLNFTAGGRSIICPADILRNNEGIVNLTGQTIWLGDANVTDDAGAYPGYPWYSGDIFTWKNTAALYGYNPGVALTNAKIARNLEV